MEGRTRPRSKELNMTVLRLGAAAVAAAAFAAPAPQGAATPSPSVGIDLAGMDRSVAPGDDFYRYANGTWTKTTEIPPDRSRYGVAYVVLDVTTQHNAEIVQEAARV